MEKTLTIMWEDKPVEIVIGEITWADKKDAIRKSIKEVHKGRQLVKEPDAILQRELVMLKSIKKAPFEATLDNLNKLRGKDAEKIHEIYAELNEVGEEEEFRDPQSCVVEDAPDRCGNE